MRRVVQVVGRYAWLLRDTVGQNRRKLLLLCALSGLAASTQGASIGILGFFIHRMTSPREIAFGPLHFVLGETEGTLGLLSASLFVALLANASASYAAARLARSAGRSCQAIVGRRVLYALATLQETDSVSLQRHQIESLAATGRRLIGRSLDMILRSIPLVLQLGVSLVITLSLQPWFTLSLLPFFLILGPFLYRLGGDVQKRARELHESAFRAATLRVRELAAVADSSRLPEAGFAQALALVFDRDATLLRFAELESELLMSGDRAVFMTSCFRSFLILAVVVVAGHASLRGALSWGELAAYLGGLGYLMNNVQGLASLGARLSRFYSWIDLYASFVDRAAGAPVIDSVRAAPAEIALRLAGAAGAGATTFILKPGAPVYFAAPAELGRLGAAALLEPLGEAAEPLAREVWTHAPFVSRALCPPGLSLADVIAAGEVGPALGEASVALERLGVWDEAASLPLGLATALDGPAWQALSSELRASAMVLCLRRSDAPVVFLADALFRDTKPHFQRAAIDLLSDRITVLVAVGPIASELDLPVLVSCDGVLSDVWDRAQHAARVRELPRANGNGEAVEDEDSDDAF